MGGETEHDFERQKLETQSVFRDLTEKHNFPAEVDLDLQFEPEKDQADWMGFQKALRKEGYASEYYASEHFDEDSYIQVTIYGLALSVVSIWEHEYQTTQIALKFGFKPDGWGFLF